MLLCNFVETIDQYRNTAGLPVLVVKRIVLYMIYATRITLRFPNLKNLLAFIRRTGLSDWALSTATLTLTSFFTNEQVAAAHQQGAVVIDEQAANETT